VSLKIGKNFVMGKFCDLEASPFKAEFRGGRRVLLPAEAGVVIGDDVTLGSHVVINKGVTRPTRIGDRCFIWHHTIIGHGCIIGNDVCIGVNSTVSGKVEIGEYSFIAAGTVISPYVKVGKYCMVGAMSNVVHDTVIPDGELWFGNPAAKRRANEWRPPT